MCDVRAIASTQGYLFAGLVTVAGIVGSGSAPKFLADMAVIDMRLLLLLCSFPLVLGIGVSFQLLLIKAHGSVVAAACQVFRKIASVAISMVVFHRVFGTPALVGSVFVSLSLIVKVCLRRWWCLAWGCGRLCVVLTRVWWCGLHRSCTRQLASLSLTTRLSPRLPGKRGCRTDSQQLCLRPRRVTRPLHDSPCGHESLAWHNSVRACEEARECQPTLRAVVFSFRFQL